MKSKWLAAHAYPTISIAVLGAVGLVGWQEWMAVPPKAPSTPGAPLITAPPTIDATPSGFEPAFDDPGDDLTSAGLRHAKEALLP